MPLPPGLSLTDMLTVGDQTDETGRLLLEDSAAKRARKKVERAGIAMKTEVCPYKDTPSRTGGKMNASAYEALRRDTAEMLDGFAWLAAHYFERQPDHRSTVRGLFDTSQLGTTLPLVLFNDGRAPVPPYGRLPSYVASIFKASRGIFSASVDILNRKGPPSRRITATEVVEFADAEGHLARRESGRVCAAPTRLIDRTLAVILTAEGADPGRSSLGSLVSFDRLWGFYSLQESFNQALSDYRYLMESVMEGGVRDQNELFGAVVVHEGRRQFFGDVTDAFLRKANSVQIGLNHHLGRGEPPRPLTFDELLRLL